MTDVEQDEGHHQHPTAGQYVEIGVILAVVTAIEVALFYANLGRAITIPALLALTAIKFVLVVRWFMHLRFDSRLFSRLFVAGVVLAGVVFAAVVAIMVLGQPGYGQL